MTNVLEALIAGIQVIGSRGYHYGCFDHNLFSGHRWWLSCHRGAIAGNKLDPKIDP